MITQEMKDNGYVCLNSISCPSCPDRHECVDFRVFNPWTKELNRLEGKKMCICEGKKLDLGNGLDIVIENNNLEIDYLGYSIDSSFFKEIEISFCPMCGRRL